MVGYAALGRNLTVNPGDRIAKEPQSLEEKAKQLAVNAPDITGDYIRVPTYFIVEYPNGEIKALHHVRDAKKISDAIRQMRFEEETSSQETEENHHINLTILVFVIALVLMTATILVGIF